jgi:hypothetical protein
VRKLVYFGERNGVVQNIAPESSLKENILFLTSSSGVVRTNKLPGFVFSNLSSIKKPLEPLS